MPGASKAVYDAVYARLNDNWTATEVVDANNIRVDAPRKAYVTVTIDGDEEQMSFGAPGGNTYRESGLISLHLIVDSNTGTDDLLTWADALRTLFRGKEFGGVSTRSASPAQPVDTSQSGLYYRSQIFVEYYYDLIG
jgi:hypothetical protein